MLSEREDDESSPVIFHSNFSTSGLKLMELPKEVEAVVATGTEVCFKASRGQPAVFCTENKTYNVRVADTSNTLYLSIPEVATVEGKHQGQEVQGMVKEYFELEEIPPKVEQLKELLFKVPYAGPLTEPDIDASLKKTFTQLNNEVQASIEELRTALIAVNAIEIDGCWRVLAEDYRAEIFRVILLSAVTEEMSLERLSLAKVTATIAEHDVPEFVARAILETYGKKIVTGVGAGVAEGGASAAAGAAGAAAATAGAAADGDVEMADDGGEYYTLSVESICRFEALELLKLQERWPYDAFMDSWSEAVPEGIMVKPEHLNGLALVSNAGTASAGKELCYFPVTSLPVVIKQRIGALFAKQKAWSMDTIRPYLEDLAVAPLTVDKILFKHARSYTDSSSGTKIKMYNKR